MNKKAMSKMNESNPRKKVCFFLYVGWFFCLFLFLFFSVFRSNSPLNLADVAEIRHEG